MCFNIRRAALATVVLGLTVIATILISNFKYSDANNNILVLTVVKIFSFFLAIFKCV